MTAPQTPTPTPTGTSTIEHRPAAGRYRTDLGWLDSRHSFSFGPHFDPVNVGHGLLIVSNDDTVAPGGGFGTHAHADMEIVTWVLSGELEHRDSAGNEGVLHPGLAQRMSAGRGIRHSEMNHSATEPVHFVQMWVVPDQTGIEPGYEQNDLSDALAAGGLVAVASGQGHPGAVHLHQQGAVLWVARLESGASVTVPDAPFVHLFAARGELDLTDPADPDTSALRLGAGDAARLTSAGPLTVTAAAPAEVLIWETRATARP